MTPVQAAELVLPRPRLEHLARLTDDTGVIQHALGALPLRSTGYTTDDNARALRVALQAAAAGDAQGAVLAQTCLAFLAYAQRSDGWFHNFFDYDRRPLPETPSEDCQARSLWALAEAARAWAGCDLGWAAMELFHRGLPACHRFRFARGWAGAAIAAAAWLIGEVDDDPPEGGLSTGEVARILEEAADRLVAAWHRTRTPGWAWFEDVLTYDNALLPYALLRAARATGDRRHRQVGLDALAFLVEATFREDVFWPIGNRGWWPRGGRRAEFAQQPLEAAGMVLACAEAWELTGDAGWLERARQAAAWFVGRNALGLSLYDPDTGGCRDGLEADGVNRNQGAESTLAWLTAAYAARRLPGTSVDEHARGVSMDDRTTTDGREAVGA